MYQSTQTGHAQSIILVTIGLPPFSLLVVNVLKSFWRMVEFDLRILFSLGTQYWLVANHTCFAYMSWVAFTSLYSTFPVSLHIFLDPHYQA